MKALIHTGITESLLFNAIRLRLFFKWPGFQPQYLVEFRPLEYVLNLLEPVSAKITNSHEATALRNLYRIVSDFRADIVMILYT